MILTRDETEELYNQGIGIDPMFKNGEFKLWYNYRKCDVKLLNLKKQMLANCETE